MQGFRGLATPANGMSEVPRYPLIRMELGTWQIWQARDKWVMGAVLRRCRCLVAQMLLLALIGLGSFNAMDAETLRRISIA